MGKLCSDEELAVLQNYKLARNRRIEMENGSSGRNGDFFFIEIRNFCLESIVSPCMIV